MENVDVKLRIIKQKKWAKTLLVKVLAKIGHKIPKIGKIVHICAKLLIKHPIGKPLLCATEAILRAFKKKTNKTKQS